MNIIRTLSFLSLLLCVHTCAMENPTPWRKLFEETDLKNKLDEQLKKELGYDPKIQIKYDNNPNVVHECVTVYCHGFLAAGNAHNVLDRIDKIPGDVITFNFKDASSWIKVPGFITWMTGIRSIPYFFPHIGKSSLAQNDEITDAIVVLDTLYKNGITQFVLYGQSRGGAVANNIPCVLNTVINNNNNTQQIKEWSENILKGIKLIHGDANLKDVKTALEVYPFAKLLSFFGLNSTFLESKVIPFFSLYNTENLQPIEWLSYWPENLPATYFPQHNDSKVGNKDDHEFAQALYNKNPNAIICPLNDGGHDSGINTIQYIIHSINYKHGCSYHKDKVNSGEEIIKQKSYNPQQHTGGIEAFFKTFYEQCKQEDTEKTNYFYKKLKIIFSASTLLFSLLYVKYGFPYNNIFSRILSCIPKIRS